MMLFIFMFVGLLWGEECKSVDPNEPLEVYLLTSGPGNSLYTKVGHSALWVSGGGRKETIFNWGAYDSSQKHFLWHFFMGTAEYKLAMMSRPYNIRRVQQNEQRLVAQHLDLSPTMKLAFQAELARLARPENHVYTYHWEHQNCSTLIRDLIDDVSEGSLQKLENIRTPTRRYEILRHLGSDVWSWFGWHFMASDYADEHYTRWTWMHIPIALHNGVSDASIQWSPDSQPQPLVDRNCVLNEGVWAPPSPPNRIGWMLSLGLLMSGLIWRWSQSKSRWLTIPIALWFGLFGGLSCFFILCWTMSGLVGYGFNENWFFANPIMILLPWFLWRDHTPKLWFWTLAVGVVIGICWNFIDSSTQSNTEWILLFGFPNIMIFLKRSSVAFQKQTETRSNLHI